ncbi:MAG: 3-dehydroquinate synthase [Chloroflexi bacterium]|nr:3-dehydroquinate synthase [Chloroflexota bacterium]
MSSLAIGYDILPQLGQRIREAGVQGKLFLVSDEMVGPLYAPAAIASVKDAGFRVAHQFVPAGESTKSMEQVIRLYDWLVEQRTERIDAIVALGGGVVGDLAGFVAATFLRGLAIIQVPTTLVAQVDSSIGGKTGVNHPRGKNLIGAFHQPSLIFADVSFLKTLPPRELRAGWAEVIKTALISHEGFLALLEEQAESLQRLELDVLSEVVRHCAEFKLAVVAEDEFDQGRRAILNYGHTIGHALEAAVEYQGLLHGEAIAVGMAGAARIAHRLGYLDQSEVARQDDVLHKYRLRTIWSGLEWGRVREAMHLDKKAREGSLRWVLLRGIGHPEYGVRVPSPIVEEVLKELVRP